MSVTKAGLGVPASRAQASLASVFPAPGGDYPELTRGSSSSLIARVLDPVRGSGPNGPDRVKELSDADVGRDVRWVNLDRDELKRITRRELGGPPGSLIAISQAGIDVEARRFCLGGDDLGRTPGIKATRWYALPAGWTPAFEPVVERTPSPRVREDDGPGWGRLTNAERTRIRQWFGY